MSNFIGMVFATLKKEGIDTSKMDTSEAIAKYNEIQGSGGGSSAKGEETPKTEQKTAEIGKEWTAPYKIKDKEGNQYVLVKNSQTKDGADYRTPGGMKTMSKTDIEKQEVVSATEDEENVSTISKKETVTDAPGQTKSFSEAVHQATRDWQKGEDEDWNDYHQRIDASGRELSKHLKVGDSFLYTYKGQDGKGYQETMKICKIGKDGVEYAQDKHYVKKGEAVCSFAGLYQFVGNGRMKFAKNNQTDDSAKLQKTMGV